MLYTVSDDDANTPLDLPSSEADCYSEFEDVETKWRRRQLLPAQKNPTQMGTSRNLSNHNRSWLQSHLMKTLNLNKKKMLTRKAKRASSIAFHVRRCAPIFPHQCPVILARFIKNDHLFGKYMCSGYCTSSWHTIHGPLQLLHCT